MASTYLVILDMLNGALGLGGQVGELSPLAMMFINFLGSLISIWAVMRLINPSWANGLTDVVVRTLFSIAMLNAIFNGVPGLISVLWACELGLLVIQGYLVQRVWVSQHAPIEPSRPAPDFQAHAPAE